MFCGCKFESTLNVPEVSRTSSVAISWRMSITSRAALRRTSTDACSAGIAVFMCGVVQSQLFGRGMFVYG